MAKITQHCRFTQHSQKCSTIHNNILNTDEKHNPQFPGRNSDFKLNSLLAIPHKSCFISTTNLLHLPSKIYHSKQKTKSTEQRWPEKTDARIANWWHRAVVDISHLYTTNVCQSLHLWIKKPLPVHYWSCVCRNSVCHHLLSDSSSTSGTCLEYPYNSAWYQQYTASPRWEPMTSTNQPQLHQHRISVDFLNKITNRQQLLSTTDRQ